MAGDALVAQVVTPPEVVSTTYRIEKWRAVPSGILETASGTFLLLIAVQAYQAGAIEKALIAAGGNIGLLLTPLVVQWVERRRWRIAHGASGIAWLGTLAFGLAAIFPAIGVYVAASIVAVACISALTPLVIQIYQDNFPPSQRGHLFSRTIVIRVAAAAIFAELAGRLLTENLAAYRWLMVVFGASFALSALLLWRIPSQTLAVQESTNPLRGLRYLRDDRLFRTTMIVWMLLGFAVLMMTPMRIEYLANPTYGLALTPQQIALLTAIIPAIVRLVLSPAWGWLFDRMNFFALRLTINLVYVVGVLVFFTGDSWLGLVLGSLVFGIAASGADLAWSLWVTKFAPPPLVADYMSVHTFFSGVRGVIAPLVAFQLVTRITITQFGLICTALIVAGSLVLVPELVRRHGPATS